MAITQVVGPDGKTTLPASGINDPEFGTRQLVVDQELVARLNATLNAVLLELKALRLVVCLRTNEPYLDAATYLDGTSQTV